MNTINLIYLSILVFGVILFSVLNFKVLKEIRKSAEQYKKVLDENIQRTKDSMLSDKAKVTKLNHKVKEET